MILDHLDNAQQYTGLHSGFWRAFRFLRETDLESLELGTHTIDGKRLFAIVAQDSPRGQEGAIFESHRQYIDIQYTIRGIERIGWAIADSCNAHVPFEESRDLQLYDNRPNNWFDVPARHFAVFFPHDVHAPLAGTDTPKKAVLKIAVNW